MNRTTMNCRILAGGGVVLAAIIGLASCGGSTEQVPAPAAATPHEQATEIRRCEQFGSLVLSNPVAAVEVLEYSKDPRLSELHAQYVTARGGAHATSDQAVRAASDVVAPVQSRCDEIKGDGDD